MNIIDVIEKEQMKNDSTESWEKVVQYMKLQEKEADEVGMEILVNAGYNPIRALKIVNRLPSYGDSPKERLANLENEISSHNYQISRNPAKPILKTIKAEVEARFISH